LASLIAAPEVFHHNFEIFKLEISVGDAILENIIILLVAQKFLENLRSITPENQ